MLHPTMVIQIYYLTFVVTPRPSDNRLAIKSNKDAHNLSTKQLDGWESYHAFRFGGTQMRSP